MATVISLQHQDLNGGGTTDEETEVQRGSLSRSTRESVREPGKNSVSPARSSPPCLWGPAPSPLPFPHTHRESGQYSGWGRRRPWARKCMRSKGSMWGYGGAPRVSSSHKRTPNDHCGRRQVKGLSSCPGGDRWAPPGPLPPRAL